jgi:hypothetical protein
MYRIFFAIIFSLEIWGCENKSNSELSPEKFAEVYIDLTLSKATTRDADSLIMKSNYEFLDNILKKRGLTRKRVESTINSYNEDFVKWKDFYEIVIKKLAEIKQERDSRNITNPGLSSK